MLVHQSLPIAQSHIDRSRGQSRVSILALHVIKRELWVVECHRCLICAHVLASHRWHNARPGNDRCQKVPKRCLHPALARQLGLRRSQEKAGEAKKGGSKESGARTEQRSLADTGMTLPEPYLRNQFHSTSMVAVPRTMPSQGAWSLRTA